MEANRRFHAEADSLFDPLRSRALLPCALVLCLTLSALAGCKPRADHYYPLDAPRWWHYVVRDTVLDEHREHRYLMQNAGLAPGMDNSVYLQTAQTGSADYLRHHGAGVERIASLRPGMRGPQPDNPPRVILPDPLAPGARWQTRSTIALAESRTFEPRDRIIPRHLPVAVDKQVVATDAEVEVPAGHFDHCLLVEGQGLATVPTDRGNGTASIAVEVHEWYAPGVGLVKLERRESSDSTFLKTGQQQWELLDYGP